MVARIDKPVNLGDRLGRPDLLLKQNDVADIYYTAYHYVNGCRVHGIIEYFDNGNTMFYALGRLERGSAPSHILKVFRDNINAIASF